MEEKEVGEGEVMGKGGVKGGKERRAVFRWPVAGTPHAGNMQIARLKRAHTMTEAPGRRGMVAWRWWARGGARVEKDRMYVTVHVGFDQV